MKKLLVPIIIFVACVLSISPIRFNPFPVTGAPPYGEAESDVPAGGMPGAFADWRRPDGPLKVGLQAGHWKNPELPDELARIRDTGGGSRGGGKAEWEVNLKIAEDTAAILRGRGITVDIIPATVPPGYWADVFLAIHADGSTDHDARGFKVAAPWRDYTGKTSDLVDALVTEYENATGFARDPNITRNMRGYYAFAWWRYEHAVHPMAVPAIIETGFLTNAADRKTIVDNPGVSARGIAEGIFTYFNL